MQRRRAQERNHVRWHADRAHAIWGTDLVELVSAGKVYPMALPELEASAAELAPGVKGPQLARLVALARIVAAVSEALHRPATIWSHAHVGTMLRCSRRLAGDVVRLGIAVGLFEQRPHFVRRSDGGELTPPELDDEDRRPLALERQPSYAPGPRLRDFLRARSQRLMLRTRRALATAASAPSRQVGSLCQPSITDRRSPDPDNRCPSTGTSPARSITGPGGSGGTESREDPAFLAERRGRPLELLSMPDDPVHREHRRAALREYGVATPQDFQAELDGAIAAALARGLKSGAIT